MDWECTDVFVSDCGYQFRSITTIDFVKIVEEIIRDEDIEDGAVLCFQVFYRIAADAIYKNNFSKDLKELFVVSKCISKLQEANKFDSILFLKHVTSQFKVLPLEIMWWLHENDIVYLAHYWEVVKLQSLSDDLFNFIANKKEHKLFDHKKIVESFFEELLRLTCVQRFGMRKLPRCKAWDKYCSNVLNDILEKTLAIVFQENTQQFDNFLYYLPNLSCRLPSSVLKQFFKNVLHKILLHSVDQFDEYSAYTYQRLWSSENINPNLLKIYKQIFSEYCNIRDIMNIMRETNDRINWKYTLAAVGVCIQVSSSGSKQIQEEVLSFLDISFKRGKLKPFLKCLIFIRQACLEVNMKLDYQAWFSKIFGKNSDFKNKYSPTIFKFLISSLITLIPYESKAYLQIQIKQSFDAPAKCNSLIHGYKTVCKSRLQELEMSPTLFIDGGQVTFLHLIEESIRNNSISAMMAKVVQNRDLHNIVIPQINQNKLPFITIKEMIISSDYLTEEEIDDYIEDLDLEIVQ